MTDSVRWILLVEDDRNLRSSLKWLLEDAGFVVVAAGDPARATEVSAGRAFDAAVVDLNLVHPLDGIGVLERFRAQCPEARRVLMSGDVPPGASNAFSSGLVEKFLLKPVTGTALITAINGLANPSRLVMLIEDDADTALTIAHMLRDEGYDVVTATNGLDALDLLRQGPIPDAIVLDLMMPVMDGFRFCEVRSVDPRLASIPIIVVTAVRETLLPAQLGVQAVIPKPLDLLRFGRILELLETSRR